MRILTDVRLLGKPARSGIPIFTTELVSRLLEQYPQDSFELFYPGLRKQKLPPAWTAKERVSVIDWHLPNKVLESTTRFAHWPDMSKRTQADIVLSPHFNNLEKGKLPRVLVIHDLSFIHHLGFFSLRQRFWHWLQNWKKQIQSADHLVAISHYTKADLIATAKVPADRITVVYPGISKEFKPIDPHDAALLRFQKKYEIKTPYILYLGALESRKNVSYLIKAFSLLKLNPVFKSYQLVLAGAAGSGANAIVKAAHRSKVRDSILFLSRIADQERIFLYNGAVAFACPSFFEGFGFPPLEAQACGVPVVASNRTSFIETLGDSAALVDPWKPAEFADALAAVITDPTVRASAISKGLANAQRFDWDTTTKEIHAVLAQTHHRFYAK